MQNFNLNSNLSSFFSSSNSNSSSSSANNQLPSANLRRNSLGNYLPSHNANNEPSSSLNYSTLYSNDDVFNDNDFNLINFNTAANRNSMLTSSNDDAISSGQDSLLSSSMLLNAVLQQQQQQQKQHVQNQSQENLASFVRYCSNTGVNVNNNFHMQQKTQQQHQLSRTSNVDSLLAQSPSFTSYPSNMLMQQQQQRNALQRDNMRRRSYCVGSSSLLPVQELSRSSSPNNLYAQYQHQQDLEHKLNMLVNLTCNQSNQQNIKKSQSFSLMTPTMSSASTSLQAAYQQNKARLRAFSIDSTGMGTNSSINSYLLDSSGNNSNAYSSMTASKSLSNLNSTMPKIVSHSQSLRKLDSLEEKLAITGNIFQKRDDWSIIEKVPINKQNTIHMRLEDEGPFGNDEIRCFVLSHFSSLAIKELKCICCDCELIIYDRFPLIDGTLFLSPVNYDKTKSIPAILPQSLSKQQQQQPQYINAICLKCLLNEENHEIKCNKCDKSWQNIGGSSLQIGTLYKYDIFAAFPCCQFRFKCNSCDTPIISYDPDGLLHFSSYSEERECPNCKTKGYHFIKPLASIYIESSCHVEKKTNVEKASVETKEEINRTPSPCQKQSSLINVES